MTASAVDENPMTPGARLAARVIRWSQAVPLFRARGSYSRLSGAIGSGGFPQATVEFDDCPGPLDCLDGVLDLPTLIRDKVVLDFGCGYGGRTTWLASMARHVEGVEIFASMVERARAFARSRGVTNVRFSLGEERRLLFPSAHFDVVVTLDVLEHVERPDVIVSELQRVLKPDGVAIVIFTPYYGAFSHHLNYATLCPGLHWLFSASDLVSAVNSLLREPEFARLGMARQPPPHRSFNDRRWCLPTLNGLTKSEYCSLVRQTGWRIEHLRSTPLFERFRLAGQTGARLNTWMCAVPGCDELFSHNLVSVLRKPSGRTDAMENVQSRRRIA